MYPFPHIAPFEPIFPFLESQRLLRVTWTCRNTPWTHRHASCNWKAVSIYPAGPEMVFLGDLDQCIHEESHSSSLSFLGVDSN